MGEVVHLEHERLDDLPLLLGFMRHLGLPALLDRHLGHSPLHQGLSLGWLVCGWLAYILSEGDHRKAHVQEWAGRHSQTLACLVGQALRPTEFTDDRLAIVLRRLSVPAAWHAIEAALWQQTLCVYGPPACPLTGVRLDGTTTYGFHARTPEGLMQTGHSKDHHPELGQLRLMAAAAMPTGQLLATDVHPGDRPDDVGYLPLIRRVRQLLGHAGLLYSGDCKMAALATRTHLVVQGDFYLMPLPRREEAKQEREAWLDWALEEAKAWELVFDGEQFVGAGCELTRWLQGSAPEKGDPECCWCERVLLVHSRAQHYQEQQLLLERLAKAEAALASLTPPRGPGRRLCRDEATLQAKIAAVEERYDVAGLLKVSWEREEQVTERQVGPGRPTAGRARRREVQVRYRVTAVVREAAALAARCARLGWRVYGTNQAAADLPLAAAALHYRGGWCLERDFHLLIDRPLGIRPLYVRREEQIRGLTHLLTLGVRLLTLLETQVRPRTPETGEAWAGLFVGQPQRLTERPTAVSLLRALARAEITLTRVELGGQVHWHLTPLPGWLGRLLACLGLPLTLYHTLAPYSPRPPPQIREP